MEEEKREKKKKERELKATTRHDKHEKGGQRENVRERARERGWGGGREG